MKIVVGLKGPGLSELLHRGARISASNGLTVKGRAIRRFASGTAVTIQSINGKIKVSAPGSKPYEEQGPLRISAASGRLHLQLLGPESKPVHQAEYIGDLLVQSRVNRVTLQLESDLETYVRGVLRSEVPASYHIEAMKAQSVLARTYALNPRISHEPDGFDVCDSFLCCQAFNGVDPALTDRQRQAIEQTRSKILVFEGKPALALFSASAGGHTEDYANCFSDPETNKFPDDPVPYLKGVPEGKLPAGFPSEEAMRRLYRTEKPDTVDAWSASFRWKVDFSSSALESHMHHVIFAARKDPQFAPFIKGPPDDRFGRIEEFSVSERGVSGVAMHMRIKTSTGLWLISKELTIRSVFANPDLKLKRLRSARIFFDHRKDNRGILAGVTVFGLGYGHGVGLQQNGAQGLALKGTAFEEILAHYYPGAQIGSTDQLPVRNRKS